MANVNQAVILYRRTRREKFPRYEYFSALKGHGIAVVSATVPTTLIAQNNLGRIAELYPDGCVFVCRATEHSDTIAERIWTATHSPVIITPTEKNEFGVLSSEEWARWKWPDLTSLVERLLFLTNPTRIE